MFNGYPLNEKDKYLVSCKECGTKIDFMEECMVCKNKKEEEIEEKDKKEFYKELDGMSVEEKIDFILEYIRQHKKTFHGNSSLDILHSKRSPIFG